MYRPGMKENDRRIALPGWMDEGNTGLSRGGARLHRRHNYLGKSIRHMKQALAEELLSEHYAGQAGCLQKISSRRKLIAALALIILTGLIRNFYILLALWVFTAVLMLVSNLPVFKLQKRIWGFIPLITLLLSIPAMSNWVTDGSPLLMICQFSPPMTILGVHIPPDLYLTEPGVKAVSYLFLRVGLSLSMGVLLTLTTPSASLLKSLSGLGIPALVVMIIEMCYRYLVLLLNLSIEMFEARQLRTVGILSMADRRAQVGSSIAALFARSMTLADEVYLAMTARGYTGQAVVWERKTN